MPTLSYKYRIEPNKMQAAALSDMLADFCRLYNAGLEERIGAFQPVANARSEVVWGIRQHLAKVPTNKTRVVTYETRAPRLKEMRCAAPELARWSFSAEQQVLRRLEKTFKAFFGRGDGFPRFRAVSRFHAAEFRVGDGLTIRKSGRVGFVGVPGDIKVRWHRELPSKPASAILTRQCGKWYIVFHVDVEAVDRAGPDSIGIDMGLTSLLALSNGETVPRPNWTKRAAKGLRRRQRAVARCRRGSKTRRKRVAALARYHASIAAKRRDGCHKLTRDLVNRFGRIAIADVNIKGLAAGMLAKPVTDAAWAQIASMLEYKAASAGVEFVKVDPRG